MVRNFERGRSWVQVELRAKLLPTTYSPERTDKICLSWTESQFHLGTKQNATRRQRKRSGGWALWFHSLSLHYTNPITKEEMPNALVSVKQQNQ